MDLKYLVAPVLALSIFAGCSAQEESFQKPKKQKVDWDQYFPETIEDKNLRWGRERVFRDALVETERADIYSAAQITCNALSLRGEIKGTYYVLQKRFEDCMRMQTR